MKPGSRVCRALTRRKQELLAQAEWITALLSHDPPYPIERICASLDSERGFQAFVESQIRFTDELIERFSCRA